MELIFETDKCQSILCIKNAKSLGNIKVSKMSKV